MLNGIIHSHYAAPRCSLSIINITWRGISMTTSLNENRAGKYRSTNNASQMLTYEMAVRPQYIGIRKAWLTWHSQNLEEFKKKQPQTVAQDKLIRRFVTGFFPSNMDFRINELIIKRRGNVVFVGGFLHYEHRLDQSRMYWMHGFAEEFLSLLLKQPIKLEFQLVPNRHSLAYSYI